MSSTTAEVTTKRLVAVGRVTSDGVEVRTAPGDPMYVAFVSELAEADAEQLAAYRKFQADARSFFSSERAQRPVASLYEDEPGWIESRPHVASRGVYGNGSSDFGFTDWSKDYE